MLNVSNSDRNKNLTPKRCNKKQTISLTLWRKRLRNRFHQKMPSFFVIFFAS